MQDAPVTLILLIANVAFSLYGFSNMGVFERFKFHVGAILEGREWHRMITAGFLHVNVTHLLVNMLSLYFVGPTLERFFVSPFVWGDYGRAMYILLYFGSLLGGDVLALLMHRNVRDYSAVGASGAIAGLLFAIAMVEPELYVLIFFIIPMPMWLFAILYVGYSLFGVQTGRGNVGHAAHLGGALVGMTIVCAFVPRLIVEHWVLFLVLTVPSGVVLYMLYRYPDFVSNPRAIGGMFQRRRGPTLVKKEKGLEISTQAELKAELDGLLDKVNRKGLEGLTVAERRRLDELSRTLRGGNSRTDS